MSRSRAKTKGRREKGSFIAIPTDVLQHPNFKRLSNTGHKLFNALLGQLRWGKTGLNNGDLCATHSMVKEYIPSKETLQSAVDELLYFEFIILTRQGARLRKDLPNLYGFTFFAIDECGGKLDIPSTVAPPGNWRTEKAKYVKATSTKRRKRDSENSQVRQTGHDWYGKRGDKSKSDAENSICGTANGAKTAILDGSLVRQTGNFLESAIGISLSSLEKTDSEALSMRAVESGQAENINKLEQSIKAKAGTAKQEISKEELKRITEQHRKAQGISQ
ncbi:hypothetical protein J7438_13465 [Thalassotalea sp. G20_0]|uniref:hypothetical protein n=1 Tax=Thalassotalea sp. G20_0 TaxID=2821093 RepID=UPI001ADCB6D7|nr:hypothetical protein [Thalassotalea sp. G20_0]MBO9495088.1 hypothetical protein [Thalassotalea sp. G20_0]